MGAGLFGSSYFEGQRAARANTRPAFVQRDAAHGIAGIAHTVKTAQHLKSAFDDLARHVAFVGTRTSARCRRRQGHCYKQTELACQHLVTAGAIVRVQQDDFVGFRAVDLAGMAQAQHVFRVFALAFIAHPVASP